MKETKVKQTKRLPKYCHANREGDCTHPNCPQKKDWKPACPVPDLPEEG